MKVLNVQRKNLQAYAWPGGYPIAFLVRDGWRDEYGKLDFNPHDRNESVCCHKCVTDLEKWPDLIVVAEFVHWEGEPEICEWCNAEIESAYGVPEETKE